MTGRQLPLLGIIWIHELSLQIIVICTQYTVLSQNMEAQVCGTDLDHEVELRPPILLPYLPELSVFELHVVAG